MAILKSTSTVTSPSGTKSSSFAFFSITVLFFLWGFITCLNDILIPYLKEQFVLNYFRATLVQFSFFGAYFIGSVIYFFSSLNNFDLIQKVGYRNSIVIGLLISALGCGLFYPAATFHEYILFLIALFVLGLGFTVLQIAANPYVAILGPSSTASSRLNLAQGLNSFGTTIAPLIGGALIFQYLGTGLNSGSNVKTLYLLLVSALVLMAFIMRVIKLPDFQNNQTTERKAGALKYRHLILGIFAIFFYVGGEVGIGSLIISFCKLPEIAGLTEAEASRYVALYWGGLMVGRFIGAASLDSTVKAASRYLVMIGIPTVTFVSIGVLMDWTAAGYAAFFLALNLIGFLLGRAMAARTLLVFSILIVVLIGTAILGKGQIALWALVGAGLFNSIMWSNIFTLAIDGLGKYTSQGSSLLIMGILGAALLPVMQGAFADAYGVQLSFIIPLLCYVYLIVYGFLEYKRTNRQ